MSEEACTGTCSLNTTSSAASLWVGVLCLEEGRLCGQEMSKEELLDVCAVCMMCTMRGVCMGLAYGSTDRMCGLWHVDYVSRPQPPLRLIQELTPQSHLKNNACKALGKVLDTQ